MSDERKSTDELILEMHFEVKALRAEFADLRAVVEKHEPMPRSMRIAAWVIACAIAFMALHRAVFEADTNIAVRTAGLYGGP